jgi:hypothetical protein
MMSGQSSVRREAHWRSVLQEHAESGLSIRRFCQNRGIPEGSFFAWRKKLAWSPAAAKGQTVPPRDGKRRVKSRGKGSTWGKQASPTSRRSDGQPTASPPTSFVPIRLPAASEPIEVVHPQGYVVRIPNRVDLDWLGQLFQMLDRYTTRQE